MARVFIAGASGFIGRHLAVALAARGHEVTGAGRAAVAVTTTGCARQVLLDYQSPARDAWARELTRVDVVINAVGILRESGGQTFDALHVRGPQALFAAAATAGVRRIIQVSALGADADAVAVYHRSKRQADEFLAALPLDWAIVQPSLVYGPGGSSATMFDTLASLPLMAVPGDGQQRVQPVYIDDLIELLTRLVESPVEVRCRIAAVGPRPLTLREFLQELRAALGFGPTLTWRVPRVLIRIGAWLGERVPGVMLDRETLGMLERGNTAPAAPFEQWLGRAPRPVSAFITPDERSARHQSATLQWLAPLLRVGVAAMWLIAAITSLGLYPVDASLELLRTLGAPATLAPVLLFGAAFLDFALGVLTLLPRRHRLLWDVQILLVLTYTLIISVWLPHLWLEPFGPVAKNLPILALLLLLRQLEDRR